MHMGIMQAWLRLVKQPILELDHSGIACTRSLFEGNMPTQP